jgi:DNA-binding response OmpR family regulator
MRIASVDDDENQLDLIRSTLKAIGHSCLSYVDGASFLKDLRRDTFDMLIVDWQLPDTTGIDIIHTVRGSCASELPILLLTNRSDERDIMEGFRAGADDFISKPARVGELSARVQGLLRRAYQAGRADRYIWEPYVFDPQLHAVTTRDSTVHLTQKEFELALLLFRNLGRLLSRKHLLETIWPLTNPPESYLMSRSLDTHISRVRNLLQLRPEHGFRLTAVYGHGYRLESMESGADLRAAAVPLTTDPLQAA